MPPVGHDSSTARSFGPTEYAPTDDAYTKAGTPALPAALNTRALPSTFVARVTSSLREGWISQARWTTASAPENRGSRAPRVMSAAAQSVLAKLIDGSRRATPSTESTAGSCASACSTLVPTFPVAPTTTTRISALERGVGEPRAQLRDRLEHRHRAGLLELGAREAPRDHRDGRHVRGFRGLYVPRRVTDHHGVLRRRLVHRSAHEVGLRLRRLDVGRRGPRVREPARVEQIQVVLHFVRLRRACEHDGVPALLQICDEFARFRHRLDLVDERHVQRLPRRPDVVADRLVHVIRRQRRHELIAAHPDVRVDLPDRQHYAVL